jgi:hypothetical protein
MTCAFGYAFAKEIDDFPHPHPKSIILPPVASLEEISEKSGLV